MRHHVIMLFILASQAFALEEAPVRKLQDQPIEETSQNQITVTCPEIVKFKLDLPVTWTSNPCAAKFKSMSPSTAGGTVDLIQCYYTYLCGGGDYTIEKRFPGFVCKASEERKVICTKG